METTAKNTQAIDHPEGMEIKLSSKSINRAVFSWFLYLTIIGTGLFVYIWDEFTAYGFGYFLGSIAKSLNSVYFLTFFFIYFVGYIALQACILYWLGGKKWKNLRYLGNWTAVTFCLKAPIPLKYYRISLLLPFILLGLLPAVHGFCTGDGVVFYVGLYGALCSSADLTFWFKLRPFDDEDLVLSGKKPFEVSIIRRNYGKKE